MCRANNDRCQGALVVFTGCLIIFLSASSLVEAQEIEAFYGAYVYVGGEKQRNARDQAIEKALSSMNRFLRPLARAGLRQAADVPRRLVFRREEPGTISITVGHRAPILTRTDNSPQKVRVGGMKLTIRRIWKGTVLHAVASKGETHRRSEYRFAPDGKSLQVTIGIEAGIMDEPLRYHLSYTREALTRSSP